MRINSAIFGLLLALFATQAEAQVSKSVLQAEIAAQFPDNSTGAITAQKLRTVTTDIVNSFQQYLGVNNQASATYTVQVSDYGQVILFNSGSAIAVTLPQAAGSFSTFNTTFANTKDGAVTITPQGGSTIGGASTLVLARNQTAFVISNGTNYLYQMQLPFQQ